MSPDSGAVHPPAVQTPTPDQQALSLYHIMGALSSSVALSTYAGVDGLWSLVLFYGEAVASWTHTWSLPNALALTSSAPLTATLLPDATLSTTVPSSASQPSSSLVCTVPAPAELPLPSATGTVYLLAAHHTGLHSVAFLPGCLATVHASTLGALLTWTAMATATTWLHTPHLESVLHRIGCRGTPLLAVDPLSAPEPSAVDRVRVRSVWLLSGVAGTLRTETLSQQALGSRTLGHRKAVLTL